MSQQLNDEDRRLAHRHVIPSAGVEQSKQTTCEPDSEGCEQADS
jgi:hypothetical protein